MKQFFRIFLQYVFVLAFCFSCTKGQKVEKDKWEDKELVFPNSLLQLKNGKCVSLTTFRQDLKGKRKVVTIIDATCRKCIIGQLNKTDSLFGELLKGTATQMVFVLNVNPADSLYFMTTLYPDVKAKGLLLWDNGYHFETDNDILTEHVTRRTFLLDENNKIIQVGNPLYNAKLLAKYKLRLK